MEFGKFDINGDRDIIPERRLYRHEGGKKDSYYHDLPRLVLLLFMLLAAIIGHMYSTYNNKPSRLVSRSVNKMLDNSFRASIEGSSSIRNIPLALFRSRQSYSPQNGITKRSDSNEYVSDEIPFDALSALEALSHAGNIVEYDREDMYGHGTRHFDGILNLPGESESTGHAFEYWIDMRTFQAVRLIITTVERNVGIDDDGISVAQETYINIRYF